MADPEQEAAAVQMQALARGRKARQETKGGSTKAVATAPAAPTGVPTSEMRAALSAAGVSLLDAAALKAMSVKLCTWIEEYRHQQGKAKSSSWAQMFEVMDKDGGGFVSFDELCVVVRDKLGKSADDVSDSRLRALWCTLDADDSNTMAKDEMAAFFKLGAEEAATLIAQRIARGGMQRGATKHMGAISGDRVNMGGALDNVPTSAMRAELEVEGIELPDDDGLTELSIKYNEWIEEYRYKEGKGETVTFYSLFAEVDKDRSGFITFDELCEITRTKLKKKEKAMPMNELKALWCALDNDNSNSLQKDEMAAWFKRGMKDKPKPAVIKKQNTVIGADRDGSSGAIASQPTKEMKEELEKDGIALPDDEGIKAFSKKYNEWIEEYRYKEGKGSTVSFYNLFAEVDKDGSGFITFDELCEITRTKLKKKEKAMPMTQMKALWCALDDDNSNSLQKDEMAAFFRLGMPKKEKPKPGDLKKQNTVASHVGLIGADRIGTSGAIASQPTKEMREELKKKGVELPDDDGMQKLSVKYNEWLEEYRYKEGKGKATTFHNLFTEVDKDGSGFITFDELCEITRQKLKKKEKSMPMNQLKAMWCALDDDDSNSLQKNELSSFFKRGMKKVEKPKPGSLKKQNTVASHVGLIGADRVGTSGALACQPTNSMRAELEAAGMALPDHPALIEMSELLGAKLEQVRKDAGKSTSSFFNLFKEVDEDNSGFVTYDELKTVVRQKLRMKAAEMPETRLKALWCVLDADDSNSIHQDEMASFFRGEMPQPKPPKPKPRSPVRRAGTAPGGTRKESEAEKAAKRAIDREKEREEKLKWHAEYVRVKAQRLAHQAAARKRAMQAHHDGIAMGQSIANFKKQMLSDLKVNRLKSPVPVDTMNFNGRLGGGRILTLYESERLITMMERDNAPDWQWPSPPRTRHAPSTPLVENIGRLEDLLPSRGPSRPTSRSWSRLPTRPTTPTHLLPTDASSSPDKRHAFGDTRGSHANQLRDQVSASRASLVTRSDLGASMEASRAATPALPSRAATPALHSSNSMPTLND